MPFVAKQVRKLSPENLIDVTSQVPMLGSLAMLWCL